jgi:NAD(P)-dependent dehydrogenase (short-subunit alcohol dehydrogenase family)
LLLITGSGRGIGKAIAVRYGALGGGILVLEARDMNHAVQLIGQHPALTYGNIFEIRPAADMNEVMKASEQRRRKNTAR